MEGSTVDVSIVVKQLLSSVPVWAIIFTTFGGFSALVIFLTKMIIDQLKEMKADIKSLVKIIDHSRVEELPGHVEKTNEFRAKTEQEIKAIWRKIDHRRPL